MPNLKQSQNTDPIIMAVFANAAERGLGTGDLAKASGVAAASLVNWKNGTGSPQLSKLRKVAEVVGLGIVAVAKARR